MVMLDTGGRLAHYEILAKIGEGGMGEVYRARDTKQRHVGRGKIERHRPAENRA